MNKSLYDVMCDYLENNSTSKVNHCCNSRVKDIMAFVEISDDYDIKSVLSTNIISECLEYFMINTERLDSYHALMMDRMIYLHNDIKGIIKYISYNVCDYANLSSNLLDYVHTSKEFKIFYLHLLGLLVELKESSYERRY